MRNIENTMRHYALAQLTWLPLPPPEFVQLAADAGYEYAGLRVLPGSPGGISHPLITDRILLRETLARLDSTGIRISISR